MQKSNVESVIYEGRPLTQYEIDRISKRHKTILYKEIVSKFYDSKKPTWAYLVPQGINGDTYFNSFNRAIFFLGYEGKIRVVQIKEEREKQG